MEWKLLTETTIGSKTARNRIVMPPMETRLSDINGDITQGLLDYYERRAKGGAGTIIVENTFVDSLASRSSLSSSGLQSDHLITGKNQLAEIIKNNGALAIIQLSHGGRQARPGATAYEPVAPSAVMCKAIGVIPRELTRDEIITIEDSFAEAAYRAREAGFDGVELHGAHGYLIGSFLSPLTNQRPDEYGGSLENRGRFASNIIHKIRLKVGRDFIVGYRISGSEYIKGGLEPGEACKFTASIQSIIDYIHVSAGIYDSPSFSTIASTYVSPGQLLHLSRQMKRSVQIPVIAVSSIDIEMGEEVLKKQEADLIAFGRALIADPDMPKKLKEGSRADIRPCIRGNEGCISRFHTGRTIRCEVNPACGQEAKYRIRKVSVPKKVLIAGGGVSGMEAARVAALMGHKVTLIEKTDILGGHMVESSVQEFKKGEAGLLDWLKDQLQKANIKVIYNTEVTKEIIKKENPEHLIIAIGSSYNSPPLKGIENAIKAVELLRNPSAAGKEIIVVGGGLVGTEVALTLAIKKHNVMILEMTDEIAARHEPGTRAELINRFNSENVKMLTGHKVLEILTDAVIAQDNNKNKLTINADTVVLATGLVSRSIDDLMGVVPGTVFIGDCVEVRKIYQCMHEAWRAVFDFSPE